MIRKDEATRKEYDAYIESLREIEFPQLLDTTYLDHAGTTLYSSSLITSIAEDLQSNLFGNPHSASPSSHLSSVRVDEARKAVLDYFDADPDIFDVIFTANATASIKLVREAFVNSEEGYVYGYHRDCHTSIVGLRESAKEVKYFVSDEAVEQWLEDGQPGTKYDHASCLRLFAFPAQSNLSGHRCPLSWPARINQNTSNQHGNRHFILLDAASYLTTSRLSLKDSDNAADFICLSFYKIFGFPDLGALIVNKSTGAADLLVRTRLKPAIHNASDSKQHHGRYFGGGTVDMIINSPDRDEEWFAIKTGASHHASSRLQSRHHSASQSLPTANAADDVIRVVSGNIHEILEDGTLPFHSILTLNHAFRIHLRLFGKLDSIRLHTSWLIQRMYHHLSSLLHSNGKLVVKIFATQRPNNASPPFGDPECQGPILAFNILNSHGQYVGKSCVEKAAITAGFQLRTGGVCNPGGAASHLDLAPWEMRRNFTEGMRCGDDMDIVAGKPTGVVRVSLGAMSCDKDIMRFVRWVEWWFSELDSGNTDPEGSAATQAHEVEIRKLAVIEGVDPTTIAWRENSTSKSTRTKEAVDVWRNGWILVSLEQNGGRAIDDDTLARARANLCSELRPESGLLRVWRKHESTEGTPESDTVLPPQSSIRINLWNSSTNQDTIGSLSEIDSDTFVFQPHVDGPKADLNLNPEVRAFFTDLLGLDCTLARYQPQRLKSRCMCTRANCQYHHTNKDALLAHTKEHVEEFEQWLNISKRESGADQHTDLPIPPQKEERVRTQHKNFAATTRKPHLAVSRTSSDTDSKHSSDSVFPDNAGRGREKGTRLNGHDNSNDIKSEKRRIRKFLLRRLCAMPWSRGGKTGEVERGRGRMMDS